MKMLSSPVCVHMYNNIQLSLVYKAFVFQKLTHNSHYQIMSTSTAVHVSIKMIRFKWVSHV